jgi:DNA-binding NtrC family response regulator
MTHLLANRPLAAARVEGVTERSGPRMKRQKKVMVVDDESIVCERLKPALEKDGFHVETYTDGQSAIDRLAVEKFDVLVTDLKMRKPDGFDILNFVRQEAPGTKVIVITGFPTVETARESLMGGAVDFVIKPFRISQLRDLVVKVSGGLEG